jgi:hypothetical protein
MRRGEVRWGNGRFRAVSGPSCVRNLVVSGHKTGWILKSLDLAGQDNPLPAIIGVLHDTLA